MKLVLTGQIISKKNSRRMICRGNRPLLLPSQAYQNWHTGASWELKVQLNTATTKGISIVHAPIQMGIKLWSKTKRKFDLENKVSSIQDLLVDNGILEDDNMTIIKRLEVEFMGYGEDKCEIEIKSL